MPLPPNTRLGRYAIRTPIGAGGMGEVYLAEDAELERQVALKVLLPEVAGDEDRVRRFVQEAKAASALNHPAFAELNKAYERRISSVVWFKVEPQLDPLRSDPRYHELLKRVGFPPQ